MGLQAALHLIYPPQCITCDAQVTTDFGLCGTCWRETPFIVGLACGKCGAPLQGPDTDHDVGQVSRQATFCDDCLTIARPWDRGRAAMLYQDNGRAMVLAFKHGDRMDLARPAAQWLARAGRAVIEPDMLVAPVPLHWLRLFKRRYNQAALLSSGLSKLMNLDHCPDLFLRHRATLAQSGHRAARFANMAAAIRVHPRRVERIAGRHVLVIDDVMTSGATFAAVAEAALGAGAKTVTTLALARVVKDA
jgi:predicted amidophosphoribosyltransferase